MKTPSGPCAEESPEAKISGPRTLHIALLLLAIIGGLIAYKTTTSLAVIGKVQATGVLKPRFDLVPTGHAPTLSGALDRTFSYFAVVWPALLFGILISGAVRAFVSPQWLAGLFGRGRVRPQLVAAAAGAPLMLCSCCVAPVFTSVYERSSRLAPSLALMLAAPSLNPAALVLTFMLFGGKVGAVRLMMGAASVMLIGLLAERLTKANADTCRAEGVAPPETGRVPVATVFLRSCVKVAAQTLPLIAAGVVVSMLVARWLPVSGSGAAAAQVTSVVVVALVAVPLAMPTFFEIPLALMLVAAGMPAGAAAAVLIAGPATNLPSLLTVARSTGWRVPALVGAVAWVFAVAGGLLVSLL